MTTTMKTAALLVTPMLASAIACETTITPYGAPPAGPQSVESGDAGFGYVRTPTANDGGLSSGLGDAGAVGPDLRTPSGFLLVSKERLLALRRSGSRSGVDALRENADSAGMAIERTGSSLENVALMYLITNQKRYADAAWRWYLEMSKQDVRSDSYLEFGDLMRGAALLLNWCGPALTNAQQATLAEYLEKWIDELWYHPHGTKWGLNDPGNNYYYSFIEGTAYGAYALKAANRSGAQKLVDLLKEKIEGPNGSLAYLAKGGKGGDWEEGANYGLGAKRRMFSGFAAIASMGGPNYFDRSPFARESVLYAAYQIQPGKRFLAPTGDLAREPTMAVSPFDREYIQIAGYWSDDPTTRGLAAWILKDVAPSFFMESGSLRWVLYRDVLFPTPAPATPPKALNLPLHYRSPGTNWINARSGWEDSATSLTFSGTPIIDQSHAHFDTGAILLYRSGWQTVDANTYGQSGLLWDSAAHNMITVAGQVRQSERSRGLVHYSDDDKTMYAQIDASKLFTVKRTPTSEPETVLDEWTREIVYVRPSTVVLYDRVAPKPLGKDFSWNMHFAKKPIAIDAAHYASTNAGGSIGLAILEGGAPRIVQDMDLREKNTVRSWRLELAPAPSSRFLAVLEVASGAVPPSVGAEAISAPNVTGAAWADQVIVFSTRPRGEPAPLPFTFKVKELPAGSHRRYTIANLKPGSDVDVAINQAEPGLVGVRVAAGKRYHVTDEGTVQVLD